ncbi:MAG: terpene cyclase/mutase family protein [Verrucomicrobia bacterium]|nr:terpene cyclase/mutase family protein [Verrucomicrobiota bacterium]
MNLRLEMLQVARLAPNLLGDSARLVETFLNAHQTSEGAFQDREGKSDLYYSVFGLDGLLAVQAAVPADAVSRYLLQFTDPAALDFIHLCCLARCWGTIAHSAKVRCPELVRERLASQIAAYRSQDGGFNLFKGQDFGAVYAAFLAVGALQDLGVSIPDPLQLVQSLKRLETPDGGWSNDIHTKTAGTNPTAAAAVLLTNLGMPVNSAVGDWLLQRAHKLGGFNASAEIPVPDLLSTATALHALACLERDIAPVREQCLDFVDSLWTNEGGFYGHWNDDQLDCEYTYYGLLALGHLSI